MSVLSWADSYICSAHKGDDGQMHGHTWRVRAYWPYANQSAVDLKDQLERVCKQELDHTVLAHELRRAESLAGYIGRVLQAARVARAFRTHSDRRRLRYFCGVCWRKIDPTRGQE